MPTSKSTPQIPEGHEPSAGTDRPYIGGQAVLEGVMMRSPSSFAVAVRRADGSIAIRERAMKPSPSPWAKVPFVRGARTLVDSLKLGTEALRFSASLLEEDAEAAERAESKAARAARSVGNALLAFGLGLAQLTSQPDGEASVKVDEETKEGASASIAATLIIMVAFLFALPQALAWGATRAMHAPLDERSASFQALTGFFKLLVVVGYLALIRRVPEIYRVFQFHGAEHKTISTYEAHEDLIVENARKKTTLHPRCGTTFLIMTVLVSIAVWTVLAPLMPRVAGPTVVRQLAFFAMKLPFIPLLVGLTFEIQRFTARYCLTGPLRVLLWPGFMIQKITTIEPDDAQLEIALSSLRATLWREKVGVAAAPESEEALIAFPSYAALLEAPALRTAAG